MRRLLAVFLLGLAVSIFIYPSSVVHPTDTLPDNNDTRLIAYIIGQVQDNLLNHKSIFYGTFFAPYPNTLSYSDLFLTTAVITLPLRALTSSPIVIYNLAYLINSSLTFMTAYLFFSSVCRSNRRGLLAVFLFFLSGYHLIYLPHLQVYSLWAVFLALYFFQRRLFFLFFLAVTFQVAESVFPVYLIFFSVLTMVIANDSEAIYTDMDCRVSTLAMTEDGSPPPQRRGRDDRNVSLLHCGTVSLLLSLPFVTLWLYLLFPYLQLHHNFAEAVRPIRDAAHFSLGLEEVFTKYHSWTIVSLLIVSLSLRTTVKQSIQMDRHPRSGGVAMTVMLVFSLIMSLGPVIKLFGHTVKIFGLPIPLPYTFFYYFLPGFMGLRTPSRFIVLALIGACVIIGRRLSLRPFILLPLFLILIFEAQLPRPGYAINSNPPPVYQQVKKLPAESAILELPILLWNQPNHEVESVRSLYSLYHKHRRLGGFSGFAPTDWISLVEQINTSGLDPVVVDRLKKLGITHVVEGDRLLPL